MTTTGFLKRNSIIFVIMALFIVWMWYLISTAFLSTRSVVFYDVMTSGSIIDVSSQYISEIPLLRYIIEPFVGLNQVFTFNSDPTDMLVLFIVFFASLRVGLLVIDNTILTRNRKKEVIFRYIKDVLQFVTKWGSIVMAVSVVVVVTGLFTQGFLWVADHFSVIFHMGAHIGLLLLIGKSLYNAIIYFKPNLKLKVHKSTSKNPIITVLIRIKRELFYFWMAFLLIFSMNFVSAGIQYPQQHITVLDLGPDEFLFDFHCHTTMSDGHLTPEERVKWYMDQGIHGAAFTDHHHPRGALRARDYVEANNLDFTVLIGQEYTADQSDIHLNLFGIEEAIIPENYYYVGPYHNSTLYNTITLNVSNAIKYTKANGGYVIVNHYGPNATAEFKYEELRDWGVDGFEIGRGGTSRDIYDFCVANNLTAISTTDDHMNGEVREFVRLKLTDRTNKTLEHVFENLMRNNHSSIVIRMDSKPFDNFDDEFDGLDDFNNYLYNLDEYQALSWVIWSCIAFGAVLLLIRRVKKADLTKMEKQLETN